MNLTSSRILCSNDKIKSTMQIFYAPDIAGNSHILDENESKHLVRVLRETAGTPVELIDGKGKLYKGFIKTASPKACEIEITDVISDFGKRNYRLHMAISPLKNTDRTEWFVEKSVEMGVDEITPVICSRTEKKIIRSDRINNIIISAMKQSLKAFRPVLHPPVQFGEFIGKEFGGVKMIAHCNTAFLRESIKDTYARESNALILIGPEGDFTEEETAAALTMGFLSVHLGDSRLRTETAGIAACHSIYFINQ
ncbi:MAG: 16S rRNA (uracil(1498)-N(3))-methyltransferase [Bacteroidales bacterium]|nr:16S rRNA (uracil(1498)-N(3))-methyltransferase [Bacteroidales bacterium]